MATAVAAPLPQNLDAERSVLGAVLLDNALYDVAARQISEEDFLIQQHQVVFRAMGRVIEAQRPIDILTLVEDLQVRGELERAGGAGAIAQLVDGVPRIANIEFYARIVRDKALLRRVIHATHAIQEHAFAPGESSADEVIEHGERVLAELGERRQVTELVPLAQVVAENMDSLEQLLRSKHEISGLRTGYLQLDSLLTGLHGGNVVILAARPSIGKTALALNIAENVAKAGGGVAFFSLEMSRREIEHRLIASHGRLNLRALRAGGMTDASWKNVAQVLSELSSWPLYIDDANPQTVAEMAAKARWLGRKQKLALVIVDYIQLVSGARRGSYSNRNEEVGATSRALKALARTLDVPVLALSQLTRASEKEERRPQLSDLRESGAIEQDADVVLFIHRPKAFAVGLPAAERNKGELIVAKQRNGPTESVGCVFLAPFTRFEEDAPGLLQHPD